MHDLAPRNSPNDPKRLFSGCDGVGQPGIGPFVGKIHFASEESQECAALMRDLVTDRPAQRRITGFERVEDRALRDGTGNVKRYLAAGAGEDAKVLGKDDSDHVSVCTSTETTAGKSLTIGIQ